jgi:pyridoxal phosphate enzyme (YggS family)
VPDSREVELAANLATVRERIAAACAAAGRPSDEVTLVAVTKTYPAADVVRLAALGVPDIGENRDQEAAPKAAEVAAAGARVRWHFVGRLQRNKARSVAGYADLVHSVDSVRLARALAEAAQDRPAPLGVLVQVSLDGDTSRGGAVPGGPTHVDVDVDVDRVADAVAGAGSLALRGVMAVAPMDWEPAAAFARLADVAQRLRQRYPQAGIVSAGMSGDLEAAVEHGATHVRIGAALLGNRAPLR